MEKLNETLQDGVLRQYFFDEGRLVTHTCADIEPNIEHAKALTNAEVFKDGVKKNFAHAGHIPAVTVVELLKIGVDVMTATLPEIRAGLRKLGKEGFIWGS